MILEIFILEISSINNPDNRQDYFSRQVDLRMQFLEEEYYKKSAKKLAALEVDIQGMDLKAMTKKLKEISSSQHKLLMVLDTLISEQD